VAARGARAAAAPAGDRFLNGAPDAFAHLAHKADLEKLLKNEGHMPEDKFLVMSRKGKRLGVAFASTPRGEGGAGFLKFKTK
jgi:hypothetical protein